MCRRPDRLQHAGVVDQQQRLGAGHEGGQRCAGQRREQCVRVGEIERAFAEQFGIARGEIGVRGTRKAEHGDAAPQQLFGNRSTEAARMSGDDGFHGDFL